MYQIRTCFPLCSSKAYYKEKKEVLSHLGKVIKKTNDFRKNLSDIQKELKIFPEKVTNHELEEGVHILEIDESLLPYEKEQFLGRAQPIVDPRLDNAPKKLTAKKPIEEV